MKMLVSMLLLVSLSACVATRTRDEVADRERATRAFEDMKSLAGDWNGTARSGDETWPVTITYRVTSAGSAVLEDMYEGQPQEMSSLYHLDGPDLRLTHYCSAGNQPSMVLTGTALARSGETEASEKLLFFEFDRGANMASPKEGHMHSARFAFLGPDHVIATWAYYEGGELHHETHFDLTRVAAASEATAPR